MISADYNDGLWIDVLLSLSIKDFTLVETLEVDFNTGMTAITGETGAGKSLTLDALAMALGDRADTDRIRHHAERAEVAALFDISDITEARQWLGQHDFDAERECLLRRVLTREGRSRGYINGQPATMQQLQQLGDLLIDIHSQHEHQSLLRRETHRKLLDNFGQCEKLCANVATAYQQWRDARNRLVLLSENSAAQQARRELLSFQVEELDQLGLQDGELPELENQQKMLANAEAILADSHRLAALCSEDDNYNLLAGLTQATTLLSGIAQKNADLIEVEELLNNAHIQVQEASHTLRHHIDRFELDPQKLAEAEERLSLIYQQARKHKVQPEELPVLHRDLQQELELLSGGEHNIENLALEVEKLHQQYLECAGKLSRKRASTAKMLAAAVNQHFPGLAMKGADIQVELTPLSDDRASPYGLEQVELLVRTNSGLAHKPLAKVVSGGELSRISLAIQVVAAQTSATPTLVFDEVDVGIGGATADVVGSLLRGLGERGQVICVTHLPQVASRAHHHLQVSKEDTAHSVHTELVVLGENGRIEEIARMLGGVRITEQTRTHAREMLELASD